MKTNSSGVASVSLKNFEKGTYKLVAYSHSGSTQAQTIKIRVHPLIFVAANKTYKRTDTNKRYTVLLKDKINNLPIKGAQVNFKIAGRTYTVKTDAHGKASLKLSFVKTGTYAIQMRYTGRVSYSSCATTAKIVVK